MTIQLKASEQYFAVVLFINAIQSGSFQYSFVIRLFNIKGVSNVKSIKEVLWYYFYALIKQRFSFWIVCSGVVKQSAIIALFASQYYWVNFNIIKK